MTVSRPIIPRNRNVSDKRCRENETIHFMSSNFFPENRAIYKIMWKNTVVRQATHDSITRRMRFHAG